MIAHHQTISKPNPHWRISCLAQWLWKIQSNWCFDPALVGSRMSFSSSSVIRVSGHHPLSRGSHRRTSWGAGASVPTYSISSSKFKIRQWKGIIIRQKRADIMQILAAALPHKKKAEVRPWRMNTQFSLKKYLRYCGTVQRAASTKVTQMLSLTMTRWRRLLLPRLWSDIYWQPHR